MASARDPARASLETYQPALTSAGYGDITTEILPAPTFYFAEDYHQQYLHKTLPGIAAWVGRVCLSHGNGRRRSGRALAREGRLAQRGGDRRIDAQYPVAQTNRLGTHRLRQFDLVRNKTALWAQHDQPFA